MAYAAQHSSSMDMKGNWAQAKMYINQNPEIVKRLDVIWRSSTGLRIRSVCHLFIEKISWIECAKDQALAKDTFKGLLQEARSLAQQCGDIVQKHETLKDCDQLEQDFGSVTLDFVSKMVTCLNSEKATLQSCIIDEDDRHVDPSDNNYAEENKVLQQEIVDVQDQLAMRNVELDQLDEDSARCLHQWHAWHGEKEQKMKDLNAMLEGPEKVEMNKEIAQKEKECNDICRRNLLLRQAATDSLLGLVEEKLDNMLSSVWQEVHTWKDEMKRSITCLVKPKDNIVDILESLCLDGARLLLDVIQKVRRIIGTISHSQLTYQGDNSLEIMNNLQQKLEKSLELHLNTVFVVDKCPRTIRVVVGKSTSEITLNVRLLGGDAFQISHNLPTVTTWMYRDHDLRDFPDQFNPKNTICTVVNGKKMMEQNRRTKQISVYFSSVYLQKFQTAPKVPERLVSENMYSMVFTTSISVADKIYTPRTMSLPIVSVTHVMQECQARGFLIWDAAFSQLDTDRKPFDNPDETSWGRLAPVLDAYFKQNTGRGLSEDQLLYLATILFREKKVMNFDKRQITKTQLFKDPLYKKTSTRGKAGGKGEDKTVDSNKSFSFWKWFYACANLVKEKINREWIGLNGVQVIEGFMSKPKAERQLMGYDIGTFLLRFSERNIEDSNKGHPCGCLTIAVVQMCPDTNKEKIFHVKEHLSAEDLHKYGLASILNALQVKSERLCHYLYPTHSFQDTFQDHLPDQGSADDGYLKAVRTIEIFLSESQRLRHTSSLPTQSPKSSMQSPQYPTFVSEDSQPSYGPTPNTPSRIARVEPFENPSKMRRSQDVPPGTQAVGVDMGMSFANPTSPQQVQSPIQVQSPMQQVQSPMQQVQSPMQQVQSPMQQVQSPMQQMQPHFHQVQPQFHQVPSPVQQVHPMVHGYNVSSSAVPMATVPHTSHTNDLFTMTSEVNTVSNVVDIDLSSRSSHAHVAPSPSASQQAAGGSTVEALFIQDHNLAAAAAEANTPHGNEDMNIYDIGLLNLDSNLESLGMAANSLLQENGDIELELDVENSDTCLQ